MDTPNTEIMRTRVDVFVLNAVSKNDGYGYDILNYIQEKTEGHYEMKQSSVYNILKRLENQGYITSYMGTESNGGKRRYYSITEEGKKLLEYEKKEWEFSRTLIDNLVSDKAFDLQNEKPPFNPSDLRPFTPRKPKTESVVIEEDTEEDEAKSQEISKTTVQSVQIDCDEEEISANLSSSSQLFNEVASSATIANNENNSFSIPKTINNNFSSIQTGETQKANTYDVFKNNDMQKTNVYNDISVNNENDDESYRILFEEIFSKNEQKRAEEKDIDTTIDCKHINDLRLLLNKEGHRLNTYAPSSNKNYMRYIMTSKMYRDISILSYLFMALMLLTVYLAKNTFKMNSAVLLSIGCIASIFPIFCLIQYFTNPNKRKKDNIRINIILPICLVIYLGFLVLNIIIELLIPNGYSINSSEIYAPSVIALVVPFYGLIYTIFYKIEIYHQKIK